MSLDSDKSVNISDKIQKSSFMFPVKKITIVTSAYRSESYLLGYFENMLQLTNREEISIVLILNDATQKEVEIACSFQKCHPNLFQVHFTERETIGTSINRGLRVAKTAYLAYADVDDRRPADAYERQLATLEQNPDAQFTYGDFIVVKEPNQRFGRYIKTPEFDPLEFTRSSCVGPGHFFRRELLERAGYYDEQLRSGADFDFQIRAAFNCRFQKTPGVVAYYLLDSRLPSASKTPWQKIDFCVICLRYGIYDVMNYDYAAYTTLFSISQILNEKEWVSLRDLVPNYEAIIQKRQSQYAQLGVQRYLKQKRFLGKMNHILKRGVQKIRRDGFIEAFQRAYQYLQAE